jgi:hypothetical protein
MNEFINRDGEIDLEELLFSEVIQVEALKNLLIMKGIISREELLEQIIKVKESMIKHET